MFGNQVQLSPCASQALVHHPIGALVPHHSALADQINMSHSGIQVLLNPL